MNDRKQARAGSRGAHANSDTKRELRSRRLRAFLANWAKRHMPDRVKRFSARA